MAPTLRPASKGGKQPTQASQEANPDSSSAFGGDNTVMAPSVHGMNAVATATQEIPAPAPKPGKKRKRFNDKAWPWTHERPTTEQAKKDVASSGRNLIPWQREFTVFILL
jgi:hypothetical protein